MIADRAIALPPLNRVLARDLVARTRVSRLLAGYRDHPPARLDAVYDVLIALSQMLADLPELAELDINPLLGRRRRRAGARRAGPPRAAAARAGADRFAIRPYPAELVETVDWHGEPIVDAPDPPGGRAAAPRLRRAARRPTTCACASSARGASCRAASSRG